MECAIYRSEDHALLDRMAANFKPGRPFLDERGVRIGSVNHAWREGDDLMAQIECVPEDVGGCG